MTYSLVTFEFATNSNWYLASVINCAVFNTACTKQLHLCPQRCLFGHRRIRDWIAIFMCTWLRMHVTFPQTLLFHPRQNLQRAKPQPCFFFEFVIIFVDNSTTLFGKSTRRNKLSATYSSSHNSHSSARTHTSTVDNNLAISTRHLALSWCRGLLLIFY